MLDQQVGLLPFYPDSVGYRLALENSPSHLDGSIYQNFSLLNTPIRILGGDALSYIIVNSLLFTFGTILIWKAWIQYSNLEITAIHEILFFSLIIMWPASKLYISSVLREGQVLFFFALSIYSLVILSKNIPWTGGWIFLLSSMLGMYLLREDLIIVSLVFCTYVYVLDKNSIKSILLLAPIGMICTYISANILNLEYIFSPRQLARVRNFRAARYDSTDHLYMYDVNWTNWIDIALDIVPLGMKFLFSPISINHSLEWLSITIDGIYILCLIGLFVVWTIIPTVREKRETVIWFTGICLVSAAIGLIEYSATGAPRHRMPLIMLLFPIIATGLPDFGEKQVRIKL